MKADINNWSTYVNTERFFIWTRTGWRLNAINIFHTRDSQVLWSEEKMQFLSWPIRYSIIVFNRQICDPYFFL